MFTWMLSFVIIKLITLNGQWITSGNMPDKDYCMVVGYYDNIMYIIGGVARDMGLSTYNPADANSFTVINSNKTKPFDTWHYSTGYIQIGNMIYMTYPKYAGLDSSLHYLSSYDLTSGVFNRYWHYVQLPASGK